MTDDFDLQNQLHALTSARSSVTPEEAIARASLSPERSMTTTIVSDSRGRSQKLSLRSSLGWVAVLVVASLVAVAIAVVVPSSNKKVVQSSHRNGPSPKPEAEFPGAGPLASPQVVYEVATVPLSVYDTVGGQAEISNIPKKPSQSRPPLTAHGRPELLYMWASYCPFCAAENWALVMALSRFGTFTGLRTTHSSVTDFAPDTQTLSFYGATYSSKYFVFKSLDLAGNQPAKPTAKCNLNGYVCLQQISETSKDMAYLEALGGGSFPFMDFGNKVVQAGAGYGDQPLTLAGLTVSEIAKQLIVPDSSVALAAVGSANYLTAAICTMTEGQPWRVCSDPVIRRIQHLEGGASG